MVRIAAFLGFLAVAFGAGGAHGQLHDFLVAKNALGYWEKGVLYHLLHAIFLTAGLLNHKLSKLSAGLFLAGIVLFSGSLYALALTGIARMGAITPIGGLCLLAGWLTIVLKPEISNSR